MPLSDASTAVERGEIVSSTEMLAYLGRKARSKSPPMIGLRLQPKNYFMRNVSLPGAAARDFSKLLLLDLERATPFRTKDVYTAYIIEPSPAGSRTQSIRQYVIKRSLVDGVKLSIEALGLRVVSIECRNDGDSSTLPIDFLAAEREAPVSNRSPRVPFALASACLALAASASYIVIQRHEDSLAELQAQTAQLKIQAQSVRDSVLKSQAALSAINNFNSLHKDFVSRAAIIDEVTRLLPDSAWVTDFKISGATVDIAGLAATASALLPIIEKSPLFVDATSTTPLTFDPLQNKERYGIRMRLRSIPVQTSKRDEEIQ